MKLTIDCKDNTTAWLVLDAVNELADKLDEEAHAELVKNLETVARSIRHQLERV